jgi:hypothetical protein
MRTHNHNEDGKKVCVVVLQFEIQRRQTKYLQTIMRFVVLIAVSVSWFYKLYYHAVL